MTIKETSIGNFYKWVFGSNYTLIKFDGGEIHVNPRRYPLIHLYEHGYFRIIEFDNKTTFYENNINFEKFIKNNKANLKNILLMNLL